MFLYILFYILLALGSTSKCIQYSPSPVTWENVRLACEGHASVLAVWHETTCTINFNQPGLIKWCTEPNAHIAPSLYHLFTSEIPRPGFIYPVWSGLATNLSAAACAYGHGTSFPYYGTSCIGKRHVLCMYD